MSIVCYRDGILAADSLMVDGETGEWLGHMSKLHTNDRHGMFGAVGEVDEIVDFFRWVDAGFPTDFARDFTGINAIQVKLDGRVMFWTARNRVDASGSPFLAIGEGRREAIGALAMNATAFEAAMVACDYVSSCGRPVLTVHKSKPFDIPSQDNEILDSVA